jgi:DNA polymerase-3 subunit chi
MTEIRFYHLTRTRLEDALPKLLEKALERGWHAVVMAGSDARVEALTQHLWTYEERGFLPHGNKHDGHAARQPIWLTTADENPNRAKVVFLVDGAATERAADFEVVAELFDGGDGEAVQAARRRWREYKQAGFDLTYWKQTDRGRWEKAG